MRTSKFTRVRYLRISRMSIEIVNGLTEQEKAMFLDQCLSWFLKLEKGESIEPVDTGNALLNLALREEIGELHEGYIKYMQSANARKDSTTGDVPPKHPEPTGDVPPKHPVEETKVDDIINMNISDYESTNPDRISDAQRAEIEERLKALGNEKADTGFWNTAFVYGYNAVDDAITQAEMTGNGNLKYITGMVANGVNR